MRVLVLASLLAFGAGCASTAASDKPQICETVKRTGSRIAHRECRDSSRVTNVRTMNQETLRNANRGPQPGAVPSG